MSKLWIMFIFLLASLPSASECKDFSEWKKEFKEEQKKLGISEKTLKEVIDDAKFQSQIVKSDRNQAEFTFSFQAYLSKLHSKERVNRAIEQYKKLKPELEELEQKYGVQGEYLIAFWAVESNFGEYQGELRTKDALATLSCDKRRSTFFAEEYRIFINLVEAGKLSANAYSSWAGAMGHLQFLPNKIEKYSRDGDGDEKVNIFSSRKDAFETAANYLQGEGWQRDVKWGKPVLLPPKFELEVLGRKNKKTIEEWSQLDITPRDGEKFPLSSEQKSAIIVLNSGEAFMVYDNFDVIMIWNRSLHYALAIGLLADEIIKAVEKEEEEKNKKAKIRK